MTAGQTAAGSGERRHLTLVRPAPAHFADARGQRARYRVERLRGMVTYRLRYRLLGDLILGRIAPRRMKAAAWLQGFEFGCGARKRQSWWLNTMPQCEEGNACAIDGRHGRQRLVLLAGPASRPGQQPAGDAA